MTAPKTQVNASNRRFVVYGARRDPVDIPKLAKVLLELVLAEQQREAGASPSDEGGYGDRSAG